MLGCDKFFDRFVTDLTGCSLVQRALETPQITTSFVILCQNNLLIRIFRIYFNIMFFTCDASREAFLSQRTTRLALNFDILRR